MDGQDKMERVELTLPILNESVRVQVEQAGSLANWVTTKAPPAEVLQQLTKLTCADTARMICQYMKARHYFLLVDSALDQYSADKQVEEQYDYHPAMPLPARWSQHPALGLPVKPNELYAAEFERKAAVATFWFPMDFEVKLPLTKRHSPTWIDGSTVDTLTAPMTGPWDPHVGQAFVGFSVDFAAMGHGNVIEFCDIVYWPAKDIMVHVTDCFNHCFTFYAIGRSVRDYEGDLVDITELYCLQAESG